MDENKQQWIDLRRNIISQNYNLPEKEQARVDELFTRMEALADQCADQGEFEKQFAASAMAAEYNQLLTDFASYNTATQNAMSQISGKDMAAEMMKDGIKSQAKRTARSVIIQAAPDEVSDVMTYGTNLIPGVSEVRQVKNLWWYIKHLFGKS